jgi:uncharacterized membrane protein
MRETPALPGASGWRFVAWARQIAVPASLRRRVTLVALAIFLQTLLELPRDPIRAALGQTPTGLLVMAALAGSLVLLVAAVVLPEHEAARPAPRLATLALALCLIAGVIGVKQVATILIASVTPTTYYNDGTTLDHYAAELLLRGHDPYQSSSIVAALRFLHEPGQYVTPLRLGAFASRSWLDYPNAAERAAVAAGATPALESHVSYPAFSFLALVPLVWAGLPSVILFSALSLALFVIVALRAVAPEWRPWLALLVLADVPVLNATLAGSLDVTVMALIFIAWLLWRRAPVLSVMALGLALSTKQQGWLFAIFFAIFLWQGLGWQETLKRLGGALAIFVAINAPFIVHDPHAWASGVLAPLVDPMFPLGNGLVQLALAGAGPLLPQAVYSALEALALAGAIGWYCWRGARTYPELGIVLAMLPFWFAWRSLSSYFLFVGLPLAALWLAWRFPARPAQGGVAG